MGTYGLEGVVLAWKTEKLTTEQAVGQMLQILQELEKRVATLERAVSWPKTATPTAEPPPTAPASQNTAVESVAAVAQSATEIQPSVPEDAVPVSQPATVTQPSTATEQVAPAPTRRRNSAGQG
jgi:hypothetical protein